MNKLRLHTTTEMNLIQLVLSKKKKKRIHMAGEHMFYFVPHICNQPSKY